MNEKIPVHCRGDDWCALKSTSKILGHKWVPVITYHLNENEGMRFSELQEEIGGITNKTLSNNLDRMQQQGIIKREVTDDKPVKITYNVTEFGEKLAPLIKDMMKWGQDNLREGDKDEAWVK